METFSARIAALFLTTILWFSNAPAVQAAEKSPEQIEASITAALEQRHPTDTAEWWRSLGPQAPEVIERMYGQTSQTYYRVRLAQALGWYDDASVVPFLKSIAGQTPDDVVRNAAIRSVGTSAGAREEEWIAGFLKHKDVQTRYAAAETLHQLNTSSAREKLKSYLATEPAPWIAGKLEGNLPTALKPLQPSGSSEDRMSPDWAGKWSGVILTPDASGVRSQYATLEIEAAGAQDWLGKLKSGKKSKLVGAGTFTTRQVRAVRAAGDFKLPGSERGTPFESDLSLEKGYFVLRVRLPAEGVTLVVSRKN